MERVNGSSSELRNLPPFCWFDEAQLSRAFSAMQRRRYPARAVIQHANSPADGIYILLSGRVQIVHEDADGREYIAQTIRAHDFFGELGLFEAGNSIGSLHATEASEVLYIPRPIVLDCVRTNARAAMCMLEKVAKRLGACHRKLADLALTTVYQRVATVLIENTSAAEREPALPFGSEELARHVGASREMTSRVIRRMIDCGYVRRHKRKLIVLDRQALERDLTPHADLTSQMHPAEARMSLL